MTSNMTLLISAGAAAFVLLLAFLWSRSRKNQGRRYRLKAFMDKSQEDFFGTLSVAAPGLYIFPNVPASSLLEPSRANGATDHAKLAQLREQILDFAVYDNTFKLLCVIDLYDRAKNPEQDTSLDRYFKSAGVRLLRWDVESLPSIEQIGQKIAGLTNKGSLVRNTASRFGPDTLMMTAPDTVMAIRGADPVPVLRTGLSAAMLEHLTPKQVIRTAHPHIWDRLCLFAAEPKHLQKYLHSLLIQDRGEERAGFSSDVLKELSDINVENDRFLATSGNGWQTTIVNI